MLHLYLYYTLLPIFNCVYPAYSVRYNVLKICLFFFFLACLFFGYTLYNMFTSNSWKNLLVFFFFLTIDLPPNPLTSRKTKRIKYREGYMPGYKLRQSAGPCKGGLYQGTQEQNCHSQNTFLIENMQLKYFWVCYKRLI